MNKNGSPNQLPSSSRNFQTQQTLVWNRIELKIVGPCLGAGSFGKVWKAFHEADKSYYAVKQVFVDKTLNRRSGTWDKLLLEVQLLKKIENKHVVKYHYSWFEGADVELWLTKSEQTSPFGEDLSSGPRNNSLFIQMELCDITLKQWLNDNKSEDSREIQIPHILKHLTFALAAIHENKIVHRDLKPDNIFGSVQTDPNDIVWKIGDFGLARDIQINEDISSNDGNFYYRSPEGPVSSKSDVFSLGIIFLEVLSPSKKLVEDQILNFKNRETSASEIIPTLVPAGYSKEGEIIGAMLNLDPDLRLNAQDVHDAINDEITIPFIYTNREPQGRRDGLFIGREDQLKELKQRLLSLKTKKAKNNVVGIFGVSGIGKSTLCKKFAEDMKSDENIKAEYIWLDCGDIMQLRNSLSGYFNRARPNLRNFPLINTFQKLPVWSQTKAPVIVVLDNVLGDIHRSKLNDNHLFDSQLSETVRAKFLKALNYEVMQDSIDLHEEAIVDEIFDNLVQPILTDHLETDISSETVKLQTHDVLEFVKQITDSSSNFVHPSKGLMVLVTAVNERTLKLELNHKNCINLYQLKKQDSITLIKSVFKMENFNQVEIDTVVERLCRYDALTIKQAAKFYINSNGYNLQAFFEDLGLWQQNQPKDSNPRTLLPMNILFDNLDAPAIQMLCVLSFFPNNEVPIQLCVLVLQKTDTCHIVQVWEGAIDSLEKFDLITVFRHGKKTISIHFRQQIQVLQILKNYYPAFWKTVAEALTKSLAELSTIDNNFVGDKLNEIATSVWEYKSMTQDVCFLEIPLFLDDNVFPLFAKNRHTFLNETTNEGIAFLRTRDVPQNPDPNLLVLASRYISTLVYYKMDYTVAISKLLEVRKEFSSFEVTEKLNNAKNKSRIYTWFMLMMFLWLSLMIATPFTLWWYWDPYFKLWWYDIFGVGALSFNAVFVPMTQIHLFLSRSKPIIRIVFQYGIILLYVFCFAIVRFAEYKRFHPNVPSHFQVAGRNDQNWQFLMVYLIIAVVSLSSIHSVTPTCSIIYATIMHIKDKPLRIIVAYIIKNNHPELMHLIVSTTVLGLICVRYIKWIIQHGEFNIYVGVFLILLDVIIIFLIYIWCILKVFRSFIRLSLWLSYYLSKLRR